MNLSIGPDITHVPVAGNPGKAKAEKAAQDFEAVLLGSLLESLQALDDPGLIKSYLTQVLARDVSVDPGAALLEVCMKYGWITFQAELQVVTDPKHWHRYVPEAGNWHGGTCTRRIAALSAAPVPLSAPMAEADFTAGAIAGSPCGGRAPCRPTPPP